MNSPLVRPVRLGASDAKSRDAFVTPEGLFLGDGTRLIEAEIGKSGRHAVQIRPEGEIVALLKAAYGEAIDVASIANGLAAVAHGLAAGDLPRAIIAALHLRLPPLADATAADRLAKVDRLLKAGFDPGEARDEHGRWTTESGASAVGSGPIRVADSGMIMNDAAPGAVNVTDTSATPGRPTVHVALPNGSLVPDLHSTTGYLQSPVADLAPVAQAGRTFGAVYHSMLQDSDLVLSASGFFVSTLGGYLGHGGVFDYQRQGSLITGYIQLPEYRDVSNFNVGLFCQQAGLSLEDTLTIAGRFAGAESKNAKPGMPDGLDTQTAEFIKLGYKTGASGIYDR